MSRRSFLKKTALTGLGLSAFGWLETQALSYFQSLPKVNKKRIEDRIMALAKFGQDEKGHGYRVAYTQGDIEGRKWFMDLMSKAGLNPKIDAGGNIIGRREGKNPALKPIGFGSHIDMVPDGGNYDGTLGSLAALEVIEILNENKISTEHPLEVVIFANEEGGLIGSKAMVGKLTQDGLKQISQSGLVMAEGISRIGGKPEDIGTAERKKGAFHAWLELHIEQGGILDAEGLQIGVVEGIVGILDVEVTVEGFANHAGTTPMKLRKDAMLAASKLTVAVNEIINSFPGSQVGTVGKIEAFPGAYNVVPGKVIMGLEIRDLSFEKIEMLLGEIQNKAQEIATETQTSIMFRREPSFNLPALTDASVQMKIQESAMALGLKTKHMQSGAGHDTQQISLLAPVGMIFVPSVGGISHSPNEFTKAEDMENGANVLLHTILSLDKG
ncbi:N-carbamoyl-L-amino-acid hydrolase [Algoriphagus boseongensis]|uniref:N-carbamoyl-L-amino-acid hydrolase n=1 Tax=Algoriphagus boseongensis TaxID=1442587 RepID=A0A4R6T3E9_9BACT|nr:Zn-dependent hydrolase [Algoriphagus boseongensis]TDQ16242.1 N-carbamoyl-L-amino-acid hydrolase [Algoriphagus boseongensis]